MVLVVYGEIEGGEVELCVWVGVCGGAWGCVSGGGCWGVCVSGCHDICLATINLHQETSHEPRGTQLSFWYRCAARTATNGGLKNG